MGAGVSSRGTAIVTGATSGIGEVTARELARQGWSVGIVCRSRTRGESTQARIREATGCEVALHLGDLAVQRDVRHVAAEILAAHPRIHLLVNNAGVVNLKRETTPDGIEAMLAVNHLAPFLLTRLLLERLRASAPARVVNVASEGHRMVRGMRWDDLGFERRFSWWRAYCQSKLANLLFTEELARKLEGSGVTANSLHPGAVATGLGANNGWVSRLVVPLLRPFFRTPEQGAATSLHVATAPELDGVTGRYFADCREARPGRGAQDPAAARRLWEASEQLTGLGR